MANSFINWTSKEGSPEFSPSTTNIHNRQLIAHRDEEQMAMQNSNNSNRNPQLLQAQYLQTMQKKAELNPAQEVNDWRTKQNNANLKFYYSNFDYEEQVILLLLILNFNNLDFLFYFSVTLYNLDKSEQKKINKIFD